VILEYGGGDLERCEVFDVYQSDALGKGKKSVAFALMFRSQEATLTDAAVESALASVLDGLSVKLGVTLREQN
jgi:phenylalanyl-tRNA synthetase beta chain